MSDEWSIEDEDGDETEARAKPKPRSDDSHARRIARAEVTRGWNSVGVNFSDFEARQEHARLIDWATKLKRSREAGVNKLWAAAITAIVSGLIGGAVSLLAPWWGHHP